MDQPGKIIAVMDGDCALCCRGARWIAQQDRQDQVRIATVQSDIGARLMAEHGIDPYDPVSWLVVDDGKPFTALEATLHLAKTFGGWNTILLALYALPRPVRTWSYHLIARNRYRVFGRAKMCDLPDPKLRAKLIA